VYPHCSVTALFSGSNSVQTHFDSDVFDSGKIVITGKINKKSLQISTFINLYKTQYRCS